MNKITFLIKSRDAIEEMAQTPFPPGTALISITDFEWSFAELKNIPDFLLQLEFDDVDAYVYADEPKLTHAEIESKYHMFTDEMAREVADFYFDIKDEVKTIICQCEHGQSRSAAVAAALTEYINGNGIEIFAQDEYTPNKLVFRKILKELFIYCSPESNR